MPINMKHSFPAVLWAMIALVVTTSAEAVVVFNDTFDVGASTPGDDVDDPLDAEWLPVLNDPTQVNVTSSGNMVFPVGLPAFGTDNTLTAVKNGTFGGTAAQLPVDEMFTLGVGDRITISFDLQLWDAPFGPATVTGSDLGVRWGIYDVNGFGPVIRNGVIASNGSEIRQDPGTTSAGIVDGLGAGMTEGFEGPNDMVVNTSMVSPLEIGGIYSPSLTAERTAEDTMVYTFTINGATSSVTDVDDVGDNEDNIFDFSGGYFAIRNGGDDSQQDYRIDNFVLEVTSATGAAGDYDGDGFVTAADYTIWRDGVSPDSTLAGFDLWQADFGVAPAIGATSGAAVPEPASFLVLLFGLATIGPRTKRG